MWNNTTRKQLLLIMLPILATLKFDSEYINKSKYAFIVGLLTNICLSVLTFFLPSNPFFKKGHYNDSLFAHGFLDHFDYAVFLSFGIFLLLSFSMKKNFFFQYLIIIIILLIALLNSYGRVGIISFFLFTPCIILLFKKSKLNYILLGFLFCFCIISYYLFPPLNNRVHQSLENIKILYHNPSFEEKLENDALYMSSRNDSFSKNHFIEQILKNPKWVDLIKSKSPQHETSIGRRYIYLKNSISIIKEKPVFGFGANQFQYIYISKYPDMESINHPHNNFIFILCELGIVGLFLVLLIFYYQIREFFLEKNSNFLKLIFPVFFLFIMSFDNYFINHNTLALFCLFSFVIYAPFKKDLTINPSNSSR